MQQQQPQPKYKPALISNDLAVTLRYGIRRIVESGHTPDDKTSAILMFLGMHGIIEVRTC